MISKAVLVILTIGIHLTACEDQTVKSLTPTTWALDPDGSDVTSPSLTTVKNAKESQRNRGSIKFATSLGKQEPHAFEPVKRKQHFKKFNALPKRSPIKDEMNLNETVSEVQRYLKTRPDLPEISREEIVDYIHNISESPKNGEDMKEMIYESKKMTSNGAEDQSVMIVLPYKPESEDDIQELYTKNPLVKYLEAEESADSEEQEILQESTSSPRIFAYPVYRTTIEDYVTTTDPTVKSYTNYNDAEMVTKRYHFDEPKYGSAGFNHKYEEDERVKGTIVVLPVKSHQYKEDKIIAPPAVTTVKPKPFYRKRMKTTTEKPTDTDSLENFDFGETTTTTKPAKIRKNNKTNSKTASTTSGPPNREELEKLMEILPQNMKDLLENLSLNDQRVVAEPAGHVAAKARPPHPQIDPSSYSVFKPLPGGRKSEKFVDDGMKDFLASFGLLPEGDSQPRRRGKVLQPNGPKFIKEVPEVSLDIFPEDMRPVLHDLGLERQPKEKQTREHIFSPSNHSLNQSQEEMEKLKALMSSIKKIVSSNDSEPVSSELQKEIIQQIEDLDNLTLRYKNRQSSQINDEIKQIIITNKNKFNFVSLDNINENVGNGSRLGDGPDPLSFSWGETKNEVKRQVTSSSSSSSSSNSGNVSINNNSSTDEVSNSSSSSDESDSTTTTTEESPNIEGLRASFGGGETAPDDADVDSALPPKKPNGLYLLVDWNSFLEVGTEDDKRRVNIRFQPKIGDPRHFIPVTIP